MKAAVATGDGVYEIDVDSEEILDVDTALELPDDAPPALALPRVRAAAASGSTIVAVVDARPPLLVSHDAGRTWREAGGGLPRGVAVAVDSDNPDLVLYASRNRLHVSQDGGRFWRSLSLELPEITAVAWLER
ncbi:MAG: hypothetical protein M3M94_02395 [Actinomycetota bacterium]|nr:hypothetical protein [Actinomycetota bacterium]